ncbi:Hypothetical predicted protein [Podarcis lilfordi]|uniref:Uncharacterized protein n=1 Tax=Podarcis lilfordi TaxID=74358 RepID=A0AA35LJD8_9SAUR|nr:Hypothetical predicted protein [Podarcis lilfordi]
MTRRPTRRRGHERPAPLLCLNGRKRSPTRGAGGGGRWRRLFRSRGASWSQQAALMQNTFHNDWWI